MKKNFVFLIAFFVYAIVLNGIEFVYILKPLSVSDYFLTDMIGKEKNGLYVADKNYVYTSFYTYKWVNNENTYYFGVKYPHTNLYGYFYTHSIEEIPQIDINGDSTGVYSIRQYLGGVSYKGKGINTIFSLSLSVAGEGIDEDYKYGVFGDVNFGVFIKKSLFLSFGIFNLGIADESGELPVKVFSQAIFEKNIFELSVAMNYGYEENVEEITELKISPVKYLSFYINGLFSSIKHRYSGGVSFVYNNMELSLLYSEEYINSSFFTSMYGFAFSYMGY